MRSRTLDLLGFVIIVSLAIALAHSSYDYPRMYFKEGDKWVRFYE
jgi:hypothetical protein